MIYNKFIKFEYHVTKMRVFTFFGCICAMSSGYKLVSCNYLANLIIKNN
jgi:hypothetical protein